jgi:hypothetical protein
MKHFIGCSSRGGSIAMDDRSEVDQAAQAASPGVRLHLLATGGHGALPRLPP